MVCADYSKAFDTVQFRSVVSKMHSLGFSKYFLLGGSNLQVAGCILNILEVQLVQFSLFLPLLSC